MIKSVKMALVAFSIILTGCAATVTQPSGTTAPTLGVAPLHIPPASAQKIVMTVKGNPTVSATTDWQALREEWRIGMSAAASGKGLTFAFLDGDAVPASEAGTLIGVKINDYRYVSQSARIFLGVMAGNAFLDAEVEFTDLQSRRIIGTRKYSTTSSAWEGIFAAMTDKQVQLVSNQIIAEVVNKRSIDSVVASSNSSTANYAVAPATAGKQAMLPTTGEIPALAAAVTGPSTVVASSRSNNISMVQTVEFQVGASSVTVEKMAKQAGCFGGKGAGLVTPKGVTEVYRMACDNGKNFIAKCEMRQCSVIR
jgi:hypothetical protein